MKKSSLKIDVVILAAGMGTRMKSEIPKVLHPLLGKPMVEYIFQAVKDLVSDPAVVVVGNKAKMVEETLGDQARYALQEPQLGTAHAVQCAREMLKGKSDIVLVANSDFPLITTKTYRKLVRTHIESGNTLTISTVIAEDPRGFGRILRDEDGRIVRIVEEKIATPEQKKIRELNSNPYCFAADWLWEALDRVEKSEVGEYYLTDLVEIAYQEGLKVGSIEIKDHEEAIGINNRVHLAEAGKALQRRINEKWMLAGVTMVDPEKVYIEDMVTCCTRRCTCAGILTSANAARSARRCLLRTQLSATDAGCCLPCWRAQSWIMMWIWGRLGTCAGARTWVTMFIWATSAR
jgi:bifunctional UDP-N-acetylglucosamine pyrophosphorylase/glucosamine-1-phosphate N-acetyltransferase